MGLIEGLYPFQQQGAERLAAHGRLYLGDEPGLGKTRTALAGAHLAGAQRVAVICPAIVRPHWAREKVALFNGGGPALWIESYQRFVLSSEVRDAFARFAPDLAILDEAHYLKHRDAQRTKLLLGSKSGLARHIARVWPLSGTPMPRHPGELFPLLVSLWPERALAFRVPHYMDFLNRYCVWKATEFGIRVYGTRNADELRELLAPVLFRRTVADVGLQLPPIRWAVHTIGSTPAELAVLGRKLDALVTPAERSALLNGDLPPMSVNLAKARHAVGDVKAYAAADLLKEELEADPSTKRVVFAHHRSVLDTLAARLHGFGLVRVDGSTPPSAREDAIGAFQDNRLLPRVFLGQIQACATGITLTAADNVVIVEPEWSSDVNVQASKRIHRIGQSRPCLVRMLALADTLDEAIVHNHHREVAMVVDVVGA